MACGGFFYGGDSKIFKPVVKILRQKGDNPPMKKGLEINKKVPPVLTRPFGRDDKI